MPLVAIPPPKPIITERQIRLRQNAMSLAMRVFYDRIMEIRRGHTPFLYASGPPGLAKTDMALSALLEHHNELKQEWDTATDDQKDPRRTRPSDIVGELEFVSPIVRFPSSVSEASFFEKLKACSRPREIGLLDDPKTLRNEGNEGLLMGALSGDGQFGRLNKRSKDDGLEVFHGALILLDNFDPDGSGGVRTFRNAEALDDRAGSARLFFPRERAVLREYIELTAFPEYYDDPEWYDQGLFQYLFGPRSGVSKDKRGLDFQGSDEEAQEMVQDVEAWFRAFQLRVKRLSYRTLQGVLKDRVLYPDTWKEKSELLLAHHDLG